MIGNDIVDLSVAKVENNWKRKGYLEKIFTYSEQGLISSAINPDNMIWIIWTMKEASYKANNRITTIREYAPKKIECEIIQRLDNIYYGKVNYCGLNYNVQATVFQEYIHAIALFDLDDFTNVKQTIVRNYPKKYGQYLRQNNFLKAPEFLTKNEMGIPNIINNHDGSEKPVSISHHGIYLSAVSFIS